MFEKWAEKLRERTREQEEIAFKSFDETTAAPKAVPVEEPKAIKSTQDGKDSNIELKVVHPESFSEVSDIADYLLDGCTVILNLELFDPASTLRMLDFLNGVTYSTGGDIKQVAQGTYIITPHNVDVTGENA
ncbi:MAG: cell division protein SepF [Clostridia bacterium]|nr:cell division protein SepF [Clostridia bacterium]